MTFRESARLIKRTGQIPAALSRRYLASDHRLPIWQVASVALLGIIAGSYLAVVVSTPPPVWARDLLQFSRRTWGLLFIMAILGPFAGIIAVRIIGSLRRLILAVMIFELIFQFDYHFLSWDRAWQFGATGGLNISLTTGCLIFLYAWWLIDILSKRTPPPSRGMFLMVLPSLVYLAVVIVSILVAGNVMFTIFEIDLLVQAILLYFYIINTVRTREDILLIVHMLMIGLIPFSLLTVLFAFTGTGAETAKAAGEGIARSSGPLSSPNVASSYLLIVLLPVFGSIIIEQTRQWYKRLALFTVALGGLALLTTGSRGAWGSFGIAIVLLCFLAWQRGWLSIKIPLSYVILAMIAVIPFYEPILQRLFSDESAAKAESREPLNLLAIRMIEDRPVLGVGANNFAFMLPQYVTSEFTGQWIYTVHHKFLLVWAETGILGLATFLWFLGAVLWQGWQVWKGHDRFLSAVALSFMMAMVAAMIHMTVESYHGRLQLELLWVTAGVIGALHNMMYRWKNE